MKEHIEKRFRGWITWKFKSKPDVMKFLLRHDRLQIAIDKTTQQLQDALFRRPNTKTDTVAKIIDAAARFFCVVAIEKKEMDLNSEHAREMALKLTQHNPKEKLETIFDPDDESDQKRLKQYLAPKAYVTNPLHKEKTNGKE